MKRIYVLLLALILLLCTGCTSVATPSFHEIEYLDPQGISEFDNKQTHFRDIPVEVWDVVTHRTEGPYEKHFLGWALQPGSDDVRYRPGDKYNMNTDVTMYSVWSSDPQTHADRLKIDRRDNIITCKECGAKNPRVTLEQYSQLYTLFGRSYTELGNKDRQKVLNQYLIYQGMNKEFLNYLTQFKVNTRQFQQYQALQAQTTSSAALFSQAMDILDTAAAIKADKSELELGDANESAITAQWSTTSGILKFLCATRDITASAQQLHALYNDPNVTTEKCQQMIDVVNGYTSSLGTLSIYYGTMFNALSTTMDIFFERYEKRAYMLDYTGEAAKEVLGKNRVLAGKNWDMIAQVDRWPEGAGPTLKEVLTYYNELTPEAKALVDEYIEFRINYEIEQLLLSAGITYNLEDYATYLVDPD